LAQSTLPCPPFECGQNITIHHTVSGGVAPVDKTVTYGTYYNLVGEDVLCWITRNLGADRQATSDCDQAEAAGGWYWQFNRKQGYKVDDDGITRTPSTTWDETNDNSSDTWEPAKDPCTIELGDGWRMPTKTEWEGVIATASEPAQLYQTYLKIHGASYIFDYGSFRPRHYCNYLYWTNQKNNSSTAWCMGQNDVFTTLIILEGAKAAGGTVRCVHD
jgi:hypothetical protein